MIRSWDRFVVDFTCCHEMLGTSHVATLDHFFWSDSLSKNVIDAGVLHRPENLSDHSPIYCVLQYPDVPGEVHEQVQQKPKPSWKKSSHEQKDCYRVMLEERISQMIIPPSVTNCRNVQCRIKAHRDDLDIFTMELLETMQGVAEENLPMPASGGATSKKEKKHIPGWTEAVKPFREEAYFWHQVWMSYGRPLNTEIHVMMKKTKNRYHYQYNKYRRAEDKIKRSKLLNSCLNGEGDLFSEIKSFRKSKPVVATSMDGVKENVKEHFKQKYETLYNSADDVFELQQVEAETNAKVNDFSLDDVAKVTPDIIKQAAHKLKSGKSDPVFSFSSDCFKNATNTVYEKLSIMIQSFLVHGHITNILLLATLVPIIKDKLSSANVSKNYRSIAISSIVLKLIDWVFIILFGIKFNLNDFQFAY